MAEQIKHTTDSAHLQQTDSIHPIDRTISSRCNGLTPSEESSYLNSLIGHEIGPLYIRDKNNAHEEALEIAPFFDYSNNEIHKHEETPASEYISAIIEHFGLSDKDDKEKAARLFGLLVRSGKTYKDAGEFILDTSDEAMQTKGQLITIIDWHTKSLERRIANDKILKKRNDLIEKLDYDEVLENPEEYLYHGSGSGDQDNIMRIGLKRTVTQNPEREASIDWWAGTQELHQAGSIGGYKYFHGFGQGGKYRAKRSDLESEGFRLEPFPDNDTAVHAVRLDPIVPPSLLERWDARLCLWLPVSEYKSQNPDSQNS